MASKLTSQLEQDRVAAADPWIVRDQFAKVQGVMTRKQMQHKNLSNMDEKGILIRSADRSKVIYTYEGSGHTFTVMDDRNRELLTAMEIYVCR